MSAPIITARIHRLATEASDSVNKLRESIDQKWENSSSVTRETKAKRIVELLRATEALTTAIADQEAEG